MTKGKEKKVKIIEQPDGSTLISFKKNKQTSDEFYKILASKTKDEFLAELGKTTYKLWKDIVNYVIKSNMNPKDRSVNAVMTFCETVDVTMAVMRSLKQELIVRAIQLDIEVKKKTGKTLNFARSLDDCIIILNPQEMMKIKQQKKKATASYVA